MKHARLLMVLSRPFCLLATLLLLGVGPTVAQADDGPEARAIRRLEAVVPSWTAENRCASCHHDGDGARALLAAAAAQLPTDPKSLTASLKALSDPLNWPRDDPARPEIDSRLAVLQFAATLAAFPPNTPGLPETARRSAVERLLEIQAADGSWPIAGPDTLGTPATHGQPLATVIARQTLARLDPAAKPALERADRWLAGRPVRSILDASAVLLAQLDPAIPGSLDQRKRAVDLILKTQGTDGGWGPYPSAPPEAFDSALAVLGLSALREVECDPADLKSRLARGRAYLIQTQEEDGGWPATTRPSGGESYAQRTSTIAWALRALIATRGVGSP